MSLNPLYRLMDRVIIPQTGIIDLLDNKTKTVFTTIIMKNANDGENLLEVVELADETFMWWNPGYKD